MLTTSIEKFLHSVDQATFQRMMDDLLFHEGYKFIGAPGTVIGKNKTSVGTPDSFFAEGDFYIFCEYTTQQRIGKGKKLFKKLIEDIDHCFDTTKSKIAAHRISKIVLACTEKVLPEQHDKLLAQIKQYNPACTLELYTIQNLPFLIQRIKGLIDKYEPGIKTGHSAIRTLSDFVESTERGWQPSLSNPFTGRESEMAEAMQKLEQSDILVINGAQGTGKSKLAVQITTAFSEKGYLARVISASPVQLWDYLHYYIETDKRYVILFDDANKALPNLEYVLSFLQERNRGYVKLILTVRNYKRNTLDPYFSNQSIEELNVETLPENLLTELIKRSMPADLVLSHDGLNRILEVAKGNPRLALIARDVLLKNNSMSSLSSAETLYDEYFKQLNDEMSILQSPAKLKALGILSFYQALDYSHDQPRKILESKFGINWDELWEMYFVVEREELVDILLDEVCKMSDQVLASYCLYKAIIDPSTLVLSAADWIIVHLEVAEQRLQGAINDLITTFGYRELRDRFTEILSEVSEKIGDNATLRYKYLDLFWFYRELETLAYVERWIESLDQQEIPDLTSGTTQGPTKFSNAYVELLAPFWVQQLPMSKEAMQLELQLLYRQPQRCFDLLKSWEEALSIHPGDDESEFKRQNDFLDLLEIDLADVHRQKLASWAIASLAAHLLEYESVVVKSKGNHTISMTTVRTVYNEALVLMRNRTLRLALRAYAYAPDSVCSMLEKYTWGGIGFIPEIYQQEIDMVADFMNKTFSTDNLRHCNIVKTYLKTLKKHGLGTVDRLKKFLTAEKASIATLLTFNYLDEPDYNKVQSDKRDEMTAWLKGRSAESIEIVLETVVEKINYTGIDEIPNGLNFLLRIASEQNKPVFLHALTYMKEKKIPTTVDIAETLIHALHNGHATHSEIYAIVGTGVYPQQKRWTQAFFHGLTAEDMTAEYFMEFLRFLVNLEGDYYAYELEVYEKYTPLLKKDSAYDEISAYAEKHISAVTLVSELLFERTITNQVTFQRNFCEKCARFFSGHLSLLKAIYVKQKDRQGSHYDYSGVEFEVISNLDNRFILYYIKAAHQANHRRADLEYLNASCIWRYTDYESIVDEAIDLIMANFPNWSSFEHTVNFLFKRAEARRDHEEKMLMYISNFIQKNKKRVNHLAVIMNVVAFTFPTKSPQFVIELIQQNNDLDLFKKIQFEGKSVSVNSRIPVIEREIGLTKNMIERIKALPKPQQYVEIVQWMEIKITNLQRDRERELKSDFRER